MRVRLVVPTSRSTAPDFAITSGMRNDPPISTSSPRETMTSPPSASAFSVSSTAAALLLTTMVATSRPMSPNNLGEQPVHMHIALAALAGRQIKFQVGVALRDFDHALQRRAAQRRAPQVGVQDHARRVDHRPQRVGMRFSQSPLDLARSLSMAALQPHLHPTCPPQSRAQLIEKLSRRLHRRAHVPHARPAPASRRRAAAHPPTAAGETIRFCLIGFTTAFKFPLPPARRKRRVR